MGRPAATIGLLLLVLAAGCGMPFGGEADSPTTPTPSATPTATITQTDTPEVTRTPFPSDANTDEIVLRLSDLEPSYESGGEVVRKRDELTGETKAEFQQQGILKTHTRSYLNQNQTVAGPSIVASTVTIFDSEPAAKQGIQTIIADFTIGNASIDQIEVVSGVTATQVTFENERGSKITLLISHERNMLFYVIAFGNQQYYTETAGELLVKMLIDID